MIIEAIVEEIDMTKKVLAIYDVPAITELLTRLLTTHGFIVLTANSSEDGIAITQKESPDVVILDQRMPGKDDWQVCRQIRRLSAVPILIFSVFDNPAMVASALDAGADDYLVKPVPDAVLIAHLNTLTRRTDMNKRNKITTQTSILSN
jgi:DNA-binding response OmpR family regulator